MPLKTIFRDPLTTIKVLTRLIFCSLLFLLMAACDAEESKKERIGSLWLWGANQYGEIGDGTIENRSAPVQIGEVDDWKQISFGGHFAIALRNNGTLWAGDITAVADSDLER